MSNEAAQIEQWIYTKLAASSGITNCVGDDGNGVKNIFGHVAGNAFPRVTYNLFTSEDMNGVGVVRLQTNAEYQIKVIYEVPTTDANMTLIKAAADAIDTLFTVARDSTTVTGWAFTSIRQRMVNYFEPPPASATAKTRIKHVGGIYLIEAYAT